VLAPGGARNLLRSDRWRRGPPESYASVARSQIARGRCVVLVGGPQDAEVRPSFAGIGAVDLIGSTNIMELTALIRASTVTVTHDSLALHLAGLLRVPVVALFGPTIPHEKVSPEVSDESEPLRGSILWGGAGLPCRPCYDGVNYFPCPVNLCMREIDPDIVNSSIEKIISRATDGGR
jgi:heptosyltransferase-2